MNNIEKRTLGKSGIDVTKMGIGLWAVGGTSWGATEDSDSLSTIDKALEEGITFFDTADVYGDGHSEELLGQAMKGRRDKFIVGTKMGWKGFDHKSGVSAFTSVERVIKEVEGNLSRLKTDYIDVLQNHIGYREPNMEIVLEGFEKLKAQGKIRAYGVSTSDFEYLKEFNGHGGCSTLQIDYSILNRTAEKEIFPYCLENNIGVIVRGPLAMGILTGKFNRDSKFSSGDFRSRWYENEEEYRIFLNDLEKVEQLKELTTDRTLAQLALEFVMNHKAVSTVIPGAKNTKQLNDNITAAHHKPLTQEELTLLNKITEPMGGRKIWPA
jgi:aryl-alcohol dehydrogenase-like predicted oxidoreductase